MKKIFQRVAGIVLLIMLVSSCAFANQKLDAIGRKNLRSGNMHKSGKRFDKAIVLYLKVLEENPTHIEAAEKLGDVFYSGKQDYEKAFKYLSLAIKNIDTEIQELKKKQEEKPKKAKKYQKKINKYLKEKDKIKKYQYSSWVKLYKEGTEKIKAEDYEGALQSFMHLNEIAPDSLKTLKMIGYCYMKKDSLDKAISYLEKALSIGDDYNTRAQLADLYFKNKNYKKSAEQYELLIKANPGLPDNYYNICLVYNNLKDYDKALEKIDEFIKLKPDDKDGFALAFETARSKDKNDLKTQIKYYKRYAELDKDNPLTLQYLFSLYYQDKQYKKALEIGEKWYQLDKSKETAEMVAGCAQKAGDKTLMNKYLKLAGDIK